ncbi:chaperonin GroEL [Xinfangfangia sp. D13-10-4-6]|uniref:chaperonin GroEL n=1 Tax=Pseudogemmobacter hezensis TaxID=2737662 RepID=UPI00155572E1|nr:chaperonin GroEL [Pseudogemmobacter hezensis]NPD15089.1 chaperonin GroEL [Pseudogemmobacter hezensis]
MSAKDVIFGTEARGRMVKGIDMLANTVRVTLGPRGRNVILARDYGAPRITKDGVTVAQEVELSDRFENMGARLVREVATRTNDEAGDGTTTATVLAQAIVREGMKAVAAGLNPMDLKRGIDSAVRAAVKNITGMSRPVRDSDEIARVGTISTNGDAAIGRQIADAMERVGKDGVITVEDAKGMETTTELVEGMQFDRGYLSPHFITDPQKMAVELEDCVVLLLDSKLSALKPMLSLLEEVLEADKGLLIVTEEIESEALAMLVVNKLRAGLKVVTVKTPGFGESRKAMLEDLAILTGGEVISADLGTRLEDVTMTRLGTATKILVGKDTTTLIGGQGDKLAIASRVGHIRALIEDETSDYEKEKLQQRLARLAGGVAVIRVGGATETEVAERKDRIGDALHATRAAVEEGVVPGGGVALLLAGNLLNDLKSDNADQEAGIRIIRRALQAPLRQIAENAGLDGAVIAGKISESASRSFGFDAQTLSFVDMFEAGIVDPTKVVRIALEDATSIAGLLITTEVMIAERR